MQQLLKWCFDCGVKEITVYAFSIENLKRPQTEVMGLFHLFRLKLIQLHEAIKFNRNHPDKENRRSVGIRIFGDITLFPDDLKKVIVDISLSERADEEHYFNICLGYTSRAEITASVNDLLWGTSTGLLVQG